jgi:hypothetical protein
MSRPSQPRRLLLQEAIASQAFNALEYSALQSLPCGRVLLRRSYTNLAEGCEIQATKWYYWSALGHQDISSSLWSIHRRLTHEVKMIGEVEALYEKVCIRSRHELQFVTQANEETRHQRQ